MDLSVRRESELRSAIETLMGAEEGTVWDVTGVHGIGKSAFFDQVRSEAEGLGSKVCIIEVDMENRGLKEEFRGDYGQHASISVRWQTFLRSCELMRDCADHFEKNLMYDHFATFRLVCQQEIDRAERFNATHDVPLDFRGSRSTSASDQAMSKLRDFQRTVDNEFLTAWEELTSNRQALIILDSFDNLADDELGHWVVRMALKCPNTLTMLARAPSPIKFAEKTARLRELFLPTFTVEQVDKYLAARFAGEQSGHIHELATVVHTYTDGHPGGVDLAARLISEKGVDIAPRALRRIFDRLPADPEKLWASLVRLILDCVHEPALRKAVDAASVALSFDEPLLAKLLDLDPLKESTAGTAIESLKAYRLIEPAHDIDNESGRYRLHEFIRLSLADDIRVNHSTRWQVLHRRAAQHYFDLLQKDEEQMESGTYGQWFRYERPDWQAYKQQWIYHSGQLPECRELTRSRFALIFLEAFWWWGYYHPFSFNTKLLEDWERAAAMWAGKSATEASKDQQLADALWFLLNNYPHGHLKPATARWEEMRAGLLRVLDLCKFPPDARRPAPAERREMARCRAMVKIFLAHTVRYRDPADQAADKYYGEALRAFEKFKDDWVVAWLLFETADLALERGQDTEAVSLVAKSAARTLTFALRNDDRDEDTQSENGRNENDRNENDRSEDDRDENDRDENDDGEANFADDYDPDEQGGTWDYELLAHLHRVRADACWMRDEVAEAAVNYGRAVANAYWFQGDSHPPDAYTLRFYGEITGRAAERILALVKSDDSRVLRFIVNVREQLPATASDSAPATVARSGHAAEICALLFPRGPRGDDELGPYTNDSPFMDNWRMLAEYRTDPATELRELLTTTERTG